MYLILHGLANSQFLHMSDSGDLTVKCRVLIRLGNPYPSSLIFRKLALVYLIYLILLGSHRTTSTSPQNALKTKGAASTAPFFIFSISILTGWKK
jgi:hypothetical protein